MFAAFDSDGTTEAGQPFRETVILHQPADGSFAAMRAERTVVTRQP